MGNKTYIPLMSMIRASNVGKRQGFCSAASKPFDFGDQPVIRRCPVIGQVVRFESALQVTEVLLYEQPEEDKSMLM